MLSDARALLADLEVVHEEEQPLNHTSPLAPSSLAATMSESEGHASASSSVVCQEGGQLDLELFATPLSAPPAPSIEANSCGADTAPHVPVEQAEQEVVQPQPLCAPDASMDDSLSSAEAQLQPEPEEEPELPTQRLVLQPLSASSVATPLDSFDDLSAEDDECFDFASLCFAPPALASTSVASDAPPAVPRHLLLASPSPRKLNGRGLRMKWRDAASPSQAPQMGHVVTQLTDDTNYACQPASQHRASCPSEEDSMDAALDSLMPSPSQSRPQPRSILKPLAHPIMLLHDVLQKLEEEETNPPPLRRSSRRALSAPAVATADSQQLPRLHSPPPAATASQPAIAHSAAAAASAKLSPPLAQDKRGSKRASSAAPSSLSTAKRTNATRSRKPLADLSNQL